MRIKSKIINKFKILIKGWTWKQLKVHKKSKKDDATGYWLTRWKKTFTTT